MSVVPRRTDGVATATKLGRGVVLATLALPAMAAGDIEWRYRSSPAAVTVSANPLSASQRLAFYLARGFGAEAIRPYTRVCAFSIGMQNGSDRTIRTQLSEWQAIAADGRSVRLRLPGSWEPEWQRAGVANPARIAFRWAQFQSENIFEPGDWIMGMVTLETPLPDDFRLAIRYRNDRGQHELSLEQLACSRE